MPCLPPFLQRNLTECHGVVPPQPYYEACVASGCSEQHPSTECQSMQTYAALCGLHGVCVDWRRQASGQCGKPGKDLLDVKQLGLFFLTYTPVWVPPHHQASIFHELLWTQEKTGTNQRGCSSPELVQNEWETGSWSLRSSSAEEPCVLARASPPNGNTQLPPECFALLGGTQ